MNKTSQKKSTGFGNNVKSKKDMFYYYYLPCLNPKSQVSGGVIRVSEKVKVGEVFTDWNYSVEVIESPDCKASKSPNLNKLPVLKVKPINLSEPGREPKNIYI